MNLSSRGLALLVCSVVVLAACSTDDGDNADGRIEPAIVRTTPRPLQPVGDDPPPTPELEGRVENQYDLEVSWCFNRYEVYSEQLDQTRDVTTVVDCRRPHDGEVYATYFHPAAAEAPYPGNADLEKWGKLNCYDDFAGFVGKDFELSALEVGIIRPTEDTWTGEGLHREVTCYVYVPEAQLEGPMRDSEI